MIKLKKIDINKIKKNKNIPSDERSGTYDHPMIQKNQTYLAKINSRWHTGTFSLCWYGWNFSGVYDAGYQLTYGHHPMNDGWEELYLIVDKTAKTYPMIFDILKEAIKYEKNMRQKQIEVMRE